MQSCNATGRKGASKSARSMRAEPSPCASRRQHVRAAHEEVAWRWIGRRFPGPGQERATAGLLPSGSETPVQSLSFLTIYMRPLNRSTGL